MNLVNPRERLPFDAFNLFKTTKNTAATLRTGKRSSRTPVNSRPNSDPAAPTAITAAISPDDAPRSESSAGRWKLHPTTAKMISVNEPV